MMCTYVDVLQNIVYSNYKTMESVSPNSIEL